MTHFPHLYPEERAPRVKVAGSVLALILPEDCRQVRAKLHQLSVTGGLLSLAEPLDDAVRVEVIFQIGSTTVRTKVETPLPMWATQGCLQPFRFTELSEEDRQKLERDLQSLLGTRSVPPSEGQLVDRGEPSPRGASQVVLYFDNPEDALHFTLAASASCRATGEVAQARISQNLPAKSERSVA